MAENLCEKLADLLRKKREQLNLSVEEVSKKAGVPSSVIDALENKRWSELPEPIYIKGFLKKLSKLYKLNEEEIMDMFYRCRLSQGASPQIEGIVIKKKDRKAKLSILIVFIFFVIFAFGIFSYLYLVKIPHETVKKASSNTTMNTTSVNKTEASVAEPVKSPVKEPSIKLKIKAKGGKSWYLLVVDDLKRSQGFIEPGKPLDVSCYKSCYIKLGNPSVIEILKGDERILLPFVKPCALLFTPQAFKILAK